MNSRSGLYSELNRLGYIMTSNSNALGRAGEMYALLALMNAGYKADISHVYHCGDLKITLPDGQILRGEVKTARIGADGRYNFLLTGKRGGKTETLCTLVDFVVLIAVGRSIMGTQVFIIPRIALASQQSTIKLPPISAKSKSKYHQFRQSVENISLDNVLKAQNDAWEIPF